MGGFLILSLSDLIKADLQLRAVCLYSWESLRMLLNQYLNSLFSPLFRVQVDGGSEGRGRLEVFD